MPLSSLHEEWLRDFNAKSDAELSLIANAPVGSIAPHDVPILAKHVLEERRASIRSAREEKTLSIAREAAASASEANAIARSNRRIAIAAMIIAAIAAAAAIVAAIATIKW